MFSKTTRILPLTTTPTTSLPSFLLPAFHRQFTTSPRCPSQIGKAPLTIPPEVSFSILPPLPPKTKVEVVSNRPIVHIEGPLGKLEMEVPEHVKLEHDTEARRAYVTVEDRNQRKQREMWGTTRAYLQNHILGVSEGHNAILRLVGVGYRASVEPASNITTVSPSYPGQEFVVLKVGYSHPIELPIPLGVKASTPQTTRILLQGCEKEVVMQFAAIIRKWRVPEPYKGKGIFVNGETIKLKAKKIK